MVAFFFTLQVPLVLGPLAILFLCFSHSVAKKIEFLGDYFTKAVLYDLFVVCPLLLLVILRAWWVFSRGPFFNQEMKYLLTEAGIKLESHHLNLETKWESYPLVTENKKGFALSHAETKSFIWFPKNGFSSIEEINRCRELLRKFVKDTRRLLPPIQDRQ
jgi:hypothetical protein